jgi:hypothetical protein
MTVKTLCQRHERSEVGTTAAQRESKKYSASKAKGRKALYTGYTLHATTAGLHLSKSRSKEISFIISPHCVCVRHSTEPHTPKILSRNVMFSDICSFRLGWHNRLLRALRSLLSTRVQRPDA